ncbi:MAG: GtrA family protein [Bacilli bacterium]
MKTNNENRTLLKQIINFGFVGGLSFLVDYILLFVITEYLHIPSFYSSIISFIISNIVNYILSMKFVFNTGNKRTPKEFIIFVFLSVIGLGINQGIMYLGEVVKVHYMITKLFATGIVMVWNFISKKIFLEPKKQK